MKNKNAKKIIALGAAMTLTMTGAVLTGCGKNKTVSAPVTQSGGVTDIGGVTVKDGLLNYYIFTAAVKNAYSDGSFTGDYSAVDWEKKTEDGQRLDEKIKKEAFDEMAIRQLLADVAEENGITLSSEEVAEGEKSIEEFKTTNGEEQLLTNIAALGLTSVDDYLELYKSESLYTKIEEDFNADPEKYTQGINLEDYVNDTTVSAKHILIKNDSEKFEDPKATAEEVLKKAKAGEDFNQLMTEYNEDPGETESGYTFGKGEMVQEFETAAFALKCGEISEVVETEYGYHIIKRVAGLAEYKNYLLSGIDEKTEKAVIDKVSVKKVMEDINNALNKIKEQQQSAATAGDAAVESKG